MPGNQDYPPQFAESCVAGVVGQINDFAGPYDSVSNDLIASAGESTGAPATIGGLPRDGAVPVVLTAPKAAQLPGLRESLIAASIIRLAHQIPPTNPLRDEITAVALKLYTEGGKKIVAYGESGGGNNDGSNGNSGGAALVRSPKPKKPKTGR